MTNCDKVQNTKTHGTVFYTHRKSQWGFPYDFLYSTIIFVMFKNYFDQWFF